MEELSLVIITDLKIIGERIKEQEGYKTDYQIGMFDAYTHVLSALHFSNAAILKMYADYGIDYSGKLEE